MKRVFRGVVAAGLSRPISADFNGRWRGKAAATTFFISLVEGNSGVAPLSLGGSQQPTRRARGRKVMRGGPATLKMLKMKVDPEMCMKTKDRMTQ